MQASGRLMATMAAGAVAGAAGVWVMDRVDWAMVEYGDQDAWRRTQAVRPEGKDPAHRLAGMAARAMGLEAPPQPHPVGIAVHYSVGIVPAMLYGALREHIPGGPARGLLFGLTLALLEDELVNPLVGASAPPGAYPWQAHARGLVAHLVFGVVTDALLTLFERSLRERDPRGRRPPGPPRGARATRPSRGGR